MTVNIDVSADNMFLFRLFANIMFFVAFLTGFILRIDFKNDFKNLSCTLLSKLLNAFYCGISSFLAFGCVLAYAPKFIQPFVAPLLIIMLPISCCYYPKKINMIIIVFQYICPLLFLLILFGYKM